MPDYQQMYYILFNEITNIIEQLQTVQIKTEELYINSAKTPLEIIKEIKPDDNNKNISSGKLSADDHQMKKPNKN
jgi:hypothetical protein